MQISVQRHPIEEVEADAVVTVVFQDHREDRLGLGELFDAGEISGKPFEMTLLHNLPGVRAKRLLAVGAGKTAKFNAAELRRAVGAAIRHLKSRGVTDAAVWLDTAHAGADYVAAAVEGAILGGFETDRYKTEKKDEDHGALRGGGGEWRAASGSRGGTRAYHRGSPEFQPGAGE